MNIEEALYAHLVADAGVAALISTRVYPLSIAQDVALPAIAYQRISGPRQRYHSGPSAMAEARIQITCQAAKYTQAKALAKAVRLAMDGYSGTMGGVSGVLVEFCGVVNELDGYEFETEGETVRVDVMVLYQEADVGDPLELDGGEYLEL